MSASDLVHPNGLDGETGTYLFSPRPFTDLPDPEPPPPEAEPTEEIYDPKRVSLVGIQTKDLSQTGWGVLFPPGVDPRIPRALKPLLDLREEQVGRPDFYHEIYLSPGQTADHFLTGLKAGRAAALRPDKLPLYLLIVGSPEDISYDFQLELGGSVSVGRVDFEHPREYRAYAENVVACADGRGRRPRDVAFFAVDNPGDRTTARLLHDLTRPLADRVEAECTRFGVHRIFGPRATKRRLVELYRGNGAAPPAVLFAAGHGLAFDRSYEAQQLHQGALLCSDLEGPFHEQRTIGRHAFFDADDLEDSMDFSGMVVLHYSCFGAGTPHWDTFAHSASQRVQRATQPFTARLPQKLLARPNGALAFLGHVDTAWTTSFSWHGEVSQPLAFEQTLKLLLDGQPVGAAVDPIRELWDYAARTASDLGQQHQLGQFVNRETYDHLCRARIDARGWVICGDPAVTVAARGMH